MSSLQYFDDVATQWDKMRTDFFSEAVRIKAIQTANVKPGHIAADIGAGTGFITEGLIKYGVQVMAIDQSQKMLNVLQQKFGSRGNISIHQGESQNLPLEDQSVDFAFANMYLHHVENPPLSIKEINRILKPGGKLIITDLDLHDFDFLLKEHNDRWPGFERESIKEWLLNAGFTAVNVDCVNQRCKASSSGGLKHADISIFIASGVK
ncbi:MAG: class I SAM-dependent methyltransferase [Proteobacteria bacterium]|nr:class I SAM-dependent methyltransferase [Pseudomonadota bacterium]